MVASFLLLLEVLRVVVVESYLLEGDTSKTEKEEVLVQEGPGVVIILSAKYFYVSVASFRVDLKTRKDALRRLK